MIVLLCSNLLFCLRKHFSNFLQCSRGIGERGNYMHSDIFSVYSVTKINVVGCAFQSLCAKPIRDCFIKGNENVGA